jgi:Ran GTPase-activating protein (RanGAP) involved in mRNA processing and transport
MDTHDFDRGVARIGGGATTASIDVVRIRDQQIDAMRGVMGAQQPTKLLRLHMRVPHTMNLQGMYPARATAFGTMLRNCASLLELALHGSGRGTLPAGWACGDGAVFIKALLEGNRTLTTLSLASSAIGTRTVFRLSAVLSANACGLVSLQLFDDETIDEAAAVALADMLTSNTTLRSLVVKGTKIGNTGASDIFQALLENQTLTEIGLPGNRLGASMGSLDDSLGAAIAKVLKVHPALTSLDLDNNHFSDRSIKRIADALCDHTVAGSRLKHLGLSTCISPARHPFRFDIAGGKALCDALECNPSIKELRLAGTFLAHGVPAALGAVLAGKSALTALDLGYCDFNGSAEFRELCDGIARNKTLESLNLDSCSLPAGAASAIAAILRAHPRLTDLNMHNVRDAGPDGPAIDVAGVGELCDALVTANGLGRLSRLNLAGHRLGNAGTVRIAAMLRNVHCRLRHLDLQATGIDEPGMLALGEALRSNRCLESVGLAESDGSDGAAGAIAEVIRTNTTLTELDIRGTGFSAAGVHELVDALGGNNIIRQVRADRHLFSRFGIAVPPTPVHIPLSAEQRVAFFRGYHQANCAFRQLPLDMVRRIAKCYDVLQGVRGIVKDGLGIVDMGSAGEPAPNWSRVGFRRRRLR